MVDYLDPPPSWDFESGREPVDQPRRIQWGWVLAVLAVVIVFEFTANPILGIVVGCLKFGLKDFRTAFWLRRADPIRSRGRISSWFFVTFGIVKTGVGALAAIGIILLTVICFGKGHQIAKLLQGQAIAAIVTLFACYGLGMLASCLGVSIALWRRQLVWVDSQIHRAREGRYWPPRYDVVPWGKNGAGLVVLGAATVYLLIGALALEVLGFVLWFRTGLRAHVDFAHGPTQVVLGLLAVAAFVLLVFLTIRLINAMGRRVVAFNPYQCYWPEGVFPFLIESGQT